MTEPLTLRDILKRYLIVLLAPVLLLGPLMLRGEVLFWGTPSLQFIPWWVYAARSLAQGSFPWWNALNGMGAPFLANYQLAFFYPPNWLLLFLAMAGGEENAAALVAWGFTFLSVLHLAWAGLGMSLLLRRLSFGWFGQVIGGLAYGLSGYVIARLGFVSMTWVAAWLPWLIYFSDQIASPSHGLGVNKEGRFNLLPGLTACAAMQLLAGHAQLTWYSLLFSIAWVTVGAWVGNCDSAVSRFRRLTGAWLSWGAAVGLAVGISAVQLVPTFEFLRLSHRASAVAYQEAMVYSFWPWRFLTLFSPDFFGNPANGDFWGYATYWEDHLYLGLLPLLLALSTLWLIIKGAVRRKHYQRWEMICFLWVGLLAAFWLALGQNTPLFPFLYRNVPTFSMFQAPARYLFWAAFALPVLAAVGIEHWRCPTGKGLYWFRLATAGAFAITLGAGLASFLLKNIQVSFIRATALTGIWALGFGLLTLVLPLAQKKGRLTMWQWAVILWVLADLLVTGWSLNPGVSPDFYMNQSQALDRVQPAGTGSRVFLSSRDEYALKFSRFFRFRDFRPIEDWHAVRDTLIPNLNLLDGISMVNNFDPLLLEQYGRWMAKVDELSPDVQEGWLAFMGVGAVERIDGTQQAGVRFDPVSEASRWHWYRCAVVKQTDAEAWGMIEEEFYESPRANRAIIIEDATGDMDPGFLKQPCDRDLKADVIWNSEQSNRIEFSVNAETGGWLEISDSWYPGWKAFIDGKEVSLYRADSLFRAIHVPSGKHQVLIEYQPIGFYFGGLFSILVLLFVMFQLTKWGRSLFSRPSF